MNRNPKLLLALALLAAPIVAGCQGLTSSSGKSTAVIGRVVDPSGTGVSGIEVAVVYQWENGKPGAGPPAATSSTASYASDTVPAAVTLSHPYPNPAYDPENRPVTIRIQSTADTTGKVELWAVRGGVNRAVATLLTNSTLSGTRTVTWNGEDDSGLSFPNGYYTVRVFVPAGAATPVAEAGILVNRAAPTVFGLALQDSSPFPQVLNGLSDVDGSYYAEDLPVGEAFTRTDNGGNVQGGAVVSGNLTLNFHDPAGDYADQYQNLFIGPGQQVNKSTVLQPVSAPAGPPLP